MLDQQTPVDRVLDRLEEYRQVHDNEWRTRCPAHNGNSDTSLKISAGEDGRALLHCFGGCDVLAILDALGLGPSELFIDNGRPGNLGRAKKAKRVSKKKGGDGPEIVDELPPGTFWEFKGLGGELRYVQRHKGALFVPLPDGTWRTGKGVMDDVPKVLYRLPELVAGVGQGERIFHLEGPKDTETARELGLVATTSGGVTSWQDHFVGFYTGANVVIIPDNDVQGKEYAGKVARAVSKVAASVRIVDLPGLPEKGDLTDWLGQGHTKDDLLALVEAAELWHPGAEDPWPEPQDIDTSLPPVASLERSMLPEPFSTWVFDIAERLERVPPDFVAVDALIAIASLVGRKICIRPKVYDTWECIPNLWGATIGRPASMKSPAQQAALKPLMRLATKATEDYEEAHNEYVEIHKKVDAADDKALEDELRAATKHAAKHDNGNRQGVEEVIEKMRNRERTALPLHMRYHTNDSTIEKLNELMKENPNGLLLSRDELSGFLRSMDREGHQSDRGFYLQCWNGDTSNVEDRIQRGFVYAPALCLSIVGGIQPGPLVSYINDAIAEKDRADGFLQRFQLTVWPDLLPFRRVDKSPNLEAAGKVEEIFQALDTFDPVHFGATPQDGGVPFVHFAPEAQEVFNAWRDEFEPEYTSGSYPAALESHFGKYKSLFPSLALLFEIIDFVSGNSRGNLVGVRSAWRAAAWCEYLTSHAMRLYHPAVIAPQQAAADLLEKIEEGSVTHRMKLRLIVDKGWHNLTTTEGVREAIAILEKHGWVRLVHVKPQGRGRPSEELWIHPDLR
jgi:hypothetical protein